MIHNKQFAFPLKHIKKQIEKQVNKNKMNMLN